MIQIKISIPSEDEVAAMSDAKFDELWTTIISSLPVISSTEEITEAEWAAISKEEEKVEQDEA